MPIRRACKCGALVPIGEPCGRCTKQRQTTADQRRRTDQPWRRWYWTPRWRAASKAFLAEPENVICRNPYRDHGIRVATCVDHVIPHKGNEALFWDRSNWCALCVPCNSKKAALEDGAFGNVKQRRMG